MFASRICWLNFAKRNKKAKNLRQLPSHVLHKTQNSSVRKRNVLLFRIWITHTFSFSFHLKYCKSLFNGNKNQLAQIDQLEKFFSAQSWQWRWKRWENCRLWDLSRDLARNSSKLIIESFCSLFRYEENFLKNIRP